VAPLKGRLVSLAVPDAQQTALAARLTGLDLRYPAKPGPDALVDAVIALRRTRDAWELDQMRDAAKATRAAHVAAMKATRPGGHEREIAALFDAVLAAHGATPSYQSIVTVRGEVLHNHHYTNRLEAGQLLLLDGGGELAGGLATDVTRTWPVSGRFDARQRDVYQLVLDTNVAAIARVRAGARYRDIHFAAMGQIAEGLRSLGLLKVGADLAVESGAVGLFFPHGVGHLIGLDVHDLENFGDRPAYAPGRSRPTQFGARYLRLDLDLQPDVVVTIEPGVYFVPAILRDPALRAAHAAHVDFDAAERWLGFGGVRVEDDVRVTEGDPEVLTAAIPKTVDALESLVGSGPSAAERLSA
jgi:Xaa-Pro aminopeptidase